MRNLSESRAIGALIVLVSSTALAGCSTLNTLESQARVDPRTIAAYGNVAPTGPSTASCATNKRLRGDAYDVAIDLDCFRFPPATPGSPGELAYTAAAAYAPQRNRLASILIKHSDDICTKEMGDLNAREAISNTALGMATSALSTVSSIVTGERVKSWLSGGATFTNATRDHVNAEVFRNVLSSAMAKAIGNERAVKRTALLANFGRTAGAYTVDQMIMDVNQYHQSCSFYNGLVLVVDAVNRASPTIAGAYRDKSAAIADLNMAIGDLERRIEVTRPGAQQDAYVAQLAELLAERTARQKERSALGSGAAPAEPAAEE